MYALGTVPGQGSIGACDAVSIHGLRVAKIVTCGRGIGLHSRLTGDAKFPSGIIDSSRISSFSDDIQCVIGDKIFSVEGLILAESERIAETSVGAVPRETRNVPVCDVQPRDEDDGGHPGTRPLGGARHSPRRETSR